MDENMKWFINEDFGVYPHDPTTQQQEFPADLPTAYDTEAQAEAAADVLYDEWADSMSAAEAESGYYLSGSGERSDDDSYIDYLNS